jgi:hypothetical protein
MASVGTTKWVRVALANPTRNRLLVRNVTAAADVYLSDHANPDVDVLTNQFKLTGIDEVEYKHHKGEIWALSGTAAADVRVLEE